jgi:hypothetical protein
MEQMKREGHQSTTSAASSSRRRRCCSRSIRDRRLPRVRQFSERADIPVSGIVTAVAVAEN